MTHIIDPPVDTKELRELFLQRTKSISTYMEILRIEKMKIYGLNWMKRGWDSTFQNLDRKFGAVEEILWKKIISKREEPTDSDLIHLSDALVDLANYSLFARWLIEEVYPDQYEAVATKILERSELNISTIPEA